MSDILNDGSVRAGIAEDLSIGGQTYTCIDISMTTSSNTVDRSDRRNVPSGRKVTRGTATGSMTLQLSSETQPIPAQFAVFVSTVYGNCSITVVGVSQTQGGQTTVPCTIVQNINGTPTVS
jgi:hypothetical protein